MMKPLFVFVKSNSDALDVRRDTKLNYWSMHPLLYLFGHECKFLFMDSGYKLPPLMSKAYTNKYDSFQSYLKSAVALCPAGWRNLFPFPKFTYLAKEHRPEQARTHIGVVADVVTAVVRTVVRAIGSRTVRVVEHPKRSRRRQQA